MLYTVVPLERIYSNQARSILDDYRVQSYKAEEKTEYKDIAIPHGRVYARREGNKYIVDKIHSTNMEDYLNNKYSPGSEIQIDAIN